MPYKKQSKPFDNMSRLLKGYDINTTRLAEILGVSIPTARDKLENPAKLTLANLKAIHSFGHISWEEIRASIGD